MNNKQKLLIVASLLVAACNGPLSEADMDSIFMSDGEARLHTLDPSIPTDQGVVAAPYVSQCWPIVNTSIDVSFCTNEGKVALECANNAASHMHEEGVTSCGILYKDIPLDVDNQSDNLLCCKDD